MQLYETIFRNIMSQWQKPEAVQTFVPSSKGAVLEKMTRVLLFIVCACCLSVWGSFVLIADAQSDKTTLKIGTMDLPPYGWIDKEGKKHGIIYEMSQKIGVKSGMPFTHEIYPFNRLLQMLKNGELDIISSQAHKAALDAGDKLAIQFNINVIAATKKGSGILSIEDFRNKFLVYHHSATYPQLDGLPRKIQRVKSYRGVLKILHTRANADGAVFSEPAYYYWMQNLGLTPNDFGSVILIEKSKKQWIFVRKNLPIGIRKILKREVKIIFQEHMYEQLLKKYKKI